MFEIDAEALMRRPVPSFEPLPKQQPAWRDLAVVAKKSVTHEALQAAVASAAGGVVRASTLFDIYEPKTPVPGIAADERSLALRLELRDDAQTLTDERIDERRRRRARLARGAPRRPPAGAVTGDPAPWPRPTRPRRAACSRPW